MKKKLGRAFALLLSLSIIFSSFAGRYLTVDAKEYVDTSSYESLAEIYKDYFKMGCACEAISHWGSYTANKEIGDPNKEAVIAGLFNSITCGNELKPAYNFDPNSETLFKVDKAGEEMLNWAKEKAHAGLCSV